MTHEERMALAKTFHDEWKATKEATKISMDSTIKGGKLPTDKVDSLVALYPVWKRGVNLTQGEYVSFQGKLFLVLIDHISMTEPPASTEYSLVK